MRKIIQLLIIVSLCACKQKGHNPLSNKYYNEESAIMFTIEYNKTHNHYPSYYIRELYYKYRDDNNFLDSLINKTPND